MGRAKVGMELIADEKRRQATLKSRKKGLKKKLEELSTLCDVKVCMIMYEPEKDGKPAEPEIWPNDPNEIQQLYSMYKDQTDDDRTKRTSDLSSFFKDRNDKLEAKVMKQRKKNHEAKYPTWDPRYDDLSEKQLRKFASHLDTKIEAAKARLELLKEYQRMESLSVVPVSTTNYYSSELFQRLLENNNIDESGDLRLPETGTEVISQQKTDESSGELEAVPDFDANMGQLMDPWMAKLIKCESNCNVLDGIDNSDFMDLPSVNNIGPMYCDIFPAPLDCIIPGSNFSYDPTEIQQYLLPSLGPMPSGGSGSSSAQKHSSPLDYRMAIHHDGGSPAELNFSYDPTAMQLPLQGVQMSSGSYGYCYGSGFSPMHYPPTGDFKYFDEK